MAVVDLTLNNAVSASYGALGNFGSAPRQTPGNSTVTTRTLLATTTATLLAANQYKLMTIPAGAFVKSVAVFLETAEGAIATLDVGDNDSSTQFVSNFDLNGTVGTSSASAVTAGRFYAAANNIVIDPDHDLDTAKFTIVAELVYKDK